MVSTPQDGKAHASSESESGLRLKITRVGGLLPVERSAEISLNALTSGECAAIRALFSMKAPSDETPMPDATSYKFELDGPTGHMSVTIKGLLIPAPLRRLLP